MASTATLEEPTFPRISWHRKVSQFYNRGRTYPLVSIGIILIVVFTGLLGQTVAPHDAYSPQLAKALVPPFFQPGGSFDYPLGTDQLGRDILSRLIAGARLSLIVGFVVVFFAGAVGTILGMLSGYLGGIVDTLIMRLTDSLMSMPFLILAIALAAVFGPGLLNMIVILAITGWAGYARILRGEVLKVKEQDYVKLALVAGCGTGKILMVHVFPNIVNTLVVLATIQLGATIIAAASLSFLGLGVPPPHPTWGGMLAEGRLYITSAWWVVTFPGIAISLTVLATNFLGDWLRFRLDPKYVHD